MDIFMMCCSNAFRACFGRGGWRCPLSGSPALLMRCVPHHNATEYPSTSFMQESILRSNPWLRPSINLREHVRNKFHGYRSETMVPYICVQRASVRIDIYHQCSHEYTDNQLICMPPDYLLGGSPIDCLCNNFQCDRFSTYGACWVWYFLPAWLRAEDGSSRLLY